jgi:hypothetical protein
VFRRKRQQRPVRPHPRTAGIEDAGAQRLAAALDADTGVPRQPLLTEAEALVVVELLERLTEQPVADTIADLARTLIVRILDRLEPAVPPAP